ncbi:MAG TPA: division/cell wall cluster transcriptional repressor MraZ [Thermoleophilia bacterium]|nr:division/cell wall cluster transcriptional repressor MraZ [Thermoleophilia bacterium]
MKRPMLVGEYDFTLDAKNRVAVPARLRSAFTDGMYVTVDAGPCLSGYSPEGFQAFLDRRSAGISPLSKQGRDLQRFTTANAVYQPLDGQGRITLPARQLKHGRIEREVTILGVEDHIEIWDRVGWAEYLARLEEEADATADELAAS